MRAVFLFFIFLSLLGAVARRFQERYRDTGVRITFFDVGQGDAALLQLPGGKTVLIDAGGGWKDWDIGTRELFPELARLGILRLDAALLSHPDQDHGYGFRGIFRELGVGELWFNEEFAREAEPKPLFAGLEALAKEKGIALHGVARPENWLVAGARLEAIPLAGGKTNDRSLVLFLDFAGCRALFTGDIEAAAEEALARENLFPIDLLKVAHHGSKTSSTERFLDRAAPRWAVISVGARNRYGHPHPSVLARLRRHRAQIFRTDFHGYVRFRFLPTGEVHCDTALGDCGMARCRRGVY